MNIDEGSYLAHYGILRRSGRYPWGSHNNVPQRSKSFLDYVKQLLGLGLTETEIAKGVGMTTTELRAAKAIAINQLRQADIAMAERLKAKGYSNTAIGQRMGKNESSIRALLAPGVKERNDILQTTANMLKDQVAQKKFLDVGSGVENHIGVTRDRLNVSLAMLQEEGYQVHRVKLTQVGTGEQTEYKVLVPPGVTQKDVFLNRFNIQQVAERSDDGGRSFLGVHEPLSIDSNRVAVKYADDGGADADGVIYVRPGVKDVSIGPARYAQVRIAVDGTHYLKGMAVYKDDLPKGVDLLFNTSKHDTGNKLDAMKSLKDDPENPFGSTIRQIVEVDDKGNEHVTSAMNIVGLKEGSGEEGSWDDWSRNLSSQFLSKQSPSLARAQLDKTYKTKKESLDEIMSLTNPAVKKELLERYADEVDSAAVHLKAAQLPRQATQVILPVNSLSDTEIYAPNFRNGERVALVRYPHGGTFEIPELTVNNNHPPAKKLLGRPKDAVGINSKVAERLSGADFDGDTVLVIPNNDGKIRSSSALEGLKNFDPKSAYPAYKGMKPMSSSEKQTEMGKVSNLITDMTIKGANTNELAAAVRHSMVVIDAEKHNLNYKQSALDNGIANLKRKYQGGPTAGASTLISKASATVRVPQRKPRPYADGGPIDPETGEKRYVETGSSYTDRKTGKQVLRTTKSTRLAETSDAHDLSSGTPIETIYADHANRLKALANTARKESIKVKPTPYSPSAKETYSKEVASLNAKLNRAVRNRPLERGAQVIANSTVAAKRQANPHLEPSEVKKVKNQALSTARRRMGAEAQKIEINWDEWNAIQAGAISNHKLSQILKKTDLDTVKKYATPKPKLLMTSSKVARAQSMLTAGKTQAEVAEALGVSLTTLKTSIAK